MALDHIIKQSCRFNIKNPQHRKVNEVLVNLDPEICKSKSQFLINAAEYYIDHFGKEAFTETGLVSISTRLPTTTMQSFIPRMIRRGLLPICVS